MEAVAVATAAVWIAAVGDINLDGPVGRLIKAHGPAHPVSEVRAVLSEADLAVGNLECPVSTRGKKLGKTWNFRAHPKSLAALKEAGFDLVTVANNHAFDYGLEAFLDTLAHLKKARLAYVGGGHDRAEAEAPRIVTIKGVRVGFLGLTSTHPEEGWARPKRGGVAYSDFARLPRVVKAAKEKCDVLIVLFHGGTELAEEPNEIQKAVARAAIDAGADLFLGHHPHVVQPVEVYKGKAIAYSLGNFLFVSPTPSTRPTVVARVAVTKQGVEKLEFLAYDTNWGKPVPADPRTVSPMLDRLGALTANPWITVGSWITVGQIR